MESPKLTSKDLESEGGLDKKEIERLNSALESLDPDRTGKIDVEDLRFLLRCIDFFF